MFTKQKYGRTAFYKLLLYLHSIKQLVYISFKAYFCHPCCPVVVRRFIYMKRHRDQLLKTLLHVPHDFRALSYVLSY